MEDRKGAPQLQTDQRSQQTPTQTSLRVSHCDSVAWCLHGKMATDEKSTTLKTARGKRKNQRKLMQLWTICSLRFQRLTEESTA